MDVRPLQALGEHKHDFAFDKRRDQSGAADGLRRVAQPVAEQIADQRLTLIILPLQHQIDHTDLFADELRAEIEAAPEIDVLNLTCVVHGEIGVIPRKRRNRPRRLLRVPEPIGQHLMDLRFQHGIASCESFS